MKKLVTLCTVLALAFAASMMFTACGGGDDGPGPEDTTPTVLYMMPSGTNISPSNGQAVITFSEAMSTTPGTVKLGLNGGALSPLSGGTWSSDVVYTIPYSGLSGNTNYQITVSGFKNVAGTAIVDSNQYFTTSLAAPPTPTVATAGLYKDSALSGSPLATGLSAAITYINANVDFYTYIVGSDETVSTTLAAIGSGRRLTIVGKDSNRTITFSGEGSLFTVGTNVTLVLGDKITLTGNAANNSALVTVNGSSGYLYMFAGSAIKGNTDKTNPGGGVSVTNGGFFLMQGGEISGNTAASTSSGTHAGGGVYVGSNGTFSMSAGEIKNNTAWGGCGVYVDGGTFTMSAGKISGNTVENNGGSSGIGVGVTGSSGKFTMTGGEISGHTFSGSEFFDGGGVSVYDSATFTMSGGEIKNNTLTSSNTYGTSGGGVYVFDEGKFTMYGGKITGNKASGSDISSGGGVEIYDGAFFMQGGEISGNTADIGGGVEINNGTFYMTGGTISGNTASFAGGGIELYYGLFRMTGGTIYGSNASAALQNKTTVANKGAAMGIDTCAAEYGTGKILDGVLALWVKKGTFPAGRMYENTVTVVRGAATY